MKQLDTNQTDATICFISRGNAECTLETLKKFLPDNEDWRFLVVHKKSFSSDKSYERIEKLSSDYPELDCIFLKEKAEYYLEASDYAKLVLEALEFVKTELIVFVSDTSEPCLEALQRTVNFMRKHNIAAVRGVTQNLEEDYYKAIENSSSIIYNHGDGIEKFGLSTVMSLNGMTYNIPILKEKNIISRYKSNLKAHRDYPHFHLNILTSANHNTYLSKETVSLEKNTSEPVAPENYFTVHSFGKRCDQIIALRNTLFEGYVDAQKNKSGKVFNSVGFYMSYVALCRQYLKLMAVENAQVYSDHIMSVEMLVKSLSVFMISAIDQFPDYQFFKDILCTQINNEGNNFLKTFRDLYTKDHLEQFPKYARSFYAN